MGGNLVTWQNKKQTVVAPFSAKAECRAMMHGVCELLWLKMLMSELGFLVPHLMHLFYDNKAAISIAQDPI